MKASDNNRQENVMQNCLEVTCAYDIRSRIRVDDGGENAYICIQMNVLRGLNRGSTITGSSVHNQRIERCCRAMWNGATNVFYNLFFFLKVRGCWNLTMMPICGVSTLCTCLV